MELGALLDMLVGAIPVARVVLEVLGSLVVIGTIVVSLTPSQDDDAVLERLKAVPILGSLILAVERFSIVVRKEQ